MGRNFNGLRGTIGLCLLVGASLALPAHADTLADIELAERTGWSNPDAGLALLRTVEPSVRRETERVELLTVRGMLAVDKREDGEAKADLERLQAMGKRGNGAATRASQVLRAHMYTQSDDFESGREKLRSLTTQSMDTPTERYRLEMVRGRALHFLDEQESATRSYETALDLARAMHSVPRELRALHRLASFNANTGNLDRASALLEP
jgi:hypothetical protein